MTIYGIGRETWGGFSYSVNFDDDVTLFTSKEKRDEALAELESNGDVVYSPFETELMA